MGTETAGRRARRRARSSAAHAGDGLAGGSAVLVLHAEGAAPMHVSGDKQLAGDDRQRPAASTECTGDVETELAPWERAVGGRAINGRLRRNVDSSTDSVSGMLSMSLDDCTVRPTRQQCSTPQCCWEDEHIDARAVVTPTPASRPLPVFGTLPSPSVCVVEIGSAVNGGTSQMAICAKVAKPRKADAPTPLAHSLRKPPHFGITRAPRGAFQMRAHGRSFSIDCGHAASLPRSLADEPSVPAGVVSFSGHHPPRHTTGAERRSATPPFPDRHALAGSSDESDVVFAGLVSGLDAEHLLPFLDAPSPPPGVRSFPGHTAMDSLRAAADDSDVFGPRGLSKTNDARRSVGSAALFGPAATVFADSDESAVRHGSLFGLPSWSSVHSPRPAAPPALAPGAQPAAPFSVDDLFTGSVESIPPVPPSSAPPPLFASLPRRHSVASIFTNIDERMAALSVDAPVPIPGAPAKAAPCVARSPPALSAAAAAFHYAPPPRHYSLPRPDAPDGLEYVPPARTGPPVHMGTYRGPLLAVEFKAGRTELFYAPDGAAPAALGDCVIVEADRGEDLGRVVAEVPARKVREAMAALASGTLPAEPWLTPEVAAVLRAPPKDVAPKRVYRRASAADLKLMQSKAHEEAVAMVRCQSRIRQKRLPMDVVDAEYQWDRNKLTFFFCADRRIDFRELVRDLFRLYKTRIWMCAVDRSSPRMAAYAASHAAALAAAADFDFDAAADCGVFDDIDAAPEAYGPADTLPPMAFGAVTHVLPPSPRVEGIGAHHALPPGAQP